ncbi:MAG: YggS family pyridoxal phosphate-dependent enzyme [Spirochaetaceae bacterium]|nr:MAG: YggS family pyridoxal phosphate-dependent enzyme [Spirochaetaceae bacterium]
MEQATIAERLGLVRERVEQALQRSARSGDNVTIMAVTKTQTSALIRAAYDAGIRCFGENRVQEAAQKYTLLLRECPDLDLQMVGHLQRNKTRDAVELFSTVQSIDKPATLEALQNWCRKSECRMDVLIEYNTSGEDTKYGVTSSGALSACVEQALRMDRLQLRGLMTIGPFTDDRNAIRGAFQTLAAHFFEIRGRFAPDSFDTLSMGMSNDYEIAVEEGATMIRLGTVLFGPRG